jgi:hypothetical protein
MTQLNNNTIYTYLYSLKKKHKHKTASLSLCLFDAANKTQKNSTVRAHVRNLTSKDKQNKYAHICVRERERESFGCIYSFEVYCWITNTHTHTQKKTEDKKTCKNYKNQERIKAQKKKNEKKKNVKRRKERDIL